MPALLAVGSRPAIGIPVGILIGIVTGTVFLLLLRTAFTGSPTLQDLGTIIAELLALPTFWFGGPWVTTQVLNLVDWTAIVTSYIISLLITFVLICLIPLLRLVWRVGNIIGDS